MPPTSIEYRIIPLHIPLKVSFKQASATHEQGASIWVEASRNGHTGLGEGCPRLYVTGEEVASGIAWLKTIIDQLRAVDDINFLRQFMNAHREEINRNPAAWCALETALLDLIARENKCNVEALLGLNSPLRSYHYSAIVGDGPADKFSQQVQQFLDWGITDFKIKINGQADHDQQKIKLFTRLMDKNDVLNYQLRLDANNLWKGNMHAAGRHLASLAVFLTGVEEPLAPGLAVEQAFLSRYLNAPIILDESICTVNDLTKYRKLVMAGSFIVNIKVSRVGGVLRALELLREIKKMQWKVIVGAHVGETSVLTRAAMCVAQVAGTDLVAQEGAFGERLLSKDPVTPSLQFGQGGQLELPDMNLTDKGYAPWTRGWGLEKRMEEEINKS